MKKVLIICILSLIILTIPIIILAIEETIYGDINQDGSVNDMDRSYLARYLEGREGYTLNDKQKNLADLNQDGSVTWYDCEIMKNYLRGTSGYEELPHIVYGDITGNLIVNDMDRSYLARYLEGREGYTLNDKQKNLADLNQDGSVTWYDCEIMKNYLRGTSGYETLPYNPNQPTTYNLIVMDGSTEYTRQQHRVGETITLATAPTKTGYTFDGLCENSELTITIPENFVMGNRDITVYIKWTEKEYTVNYNANGGSGEMQPSTCKYTLSLDLPGCDYTYAEHNFLGWDTHSDVTTPEYVPGDETKGTILGTDLATMVGENGSVTLYAIWGEKEYTVNYDANGGNGDMQPSICRHTDSLDLPGCEYTYEGHNFLGWDTHSDVTTPTYVSENGTNGTILGTNLATMVGENDSITLYAIWEEIPSTYRITYIVGSVDVGHEDYAPGANITTIGVPSANVPANKMFDAWCEDSELTRVVPTPFTMPEENITVYARFIDEQPEENNDDYTITYNKNSNTATGTMGTTVFTPDSSNVPFYGCAYQNTGYTFKGWATDANGTNIIITYDEMGGMIGQVSGENLATYATDKQVTLYAVWEVQKIQIDVYGYAKTPVMNQNNEQALDEEGNPIYSYFPKLETIEADYNGTISQNNDKLTNLDEREGYNFEGWYARINGQLQQTVFDFSTLITQSITLESKWSVDFTYDLNGGTIPNNGEISTQNVMEGENITISTIEPELAGATFLGWTTEKDAYSEEFDILYESGKTYSTDNMHRNTLYAYWSFDTTTIIYNLSGGTLQGGETIQNGTATKGNPFTVTNEIPVLEEGRTFIGWGDFIDDPYISCKSGDIIDNTEGRNVSEITLYAKYAYNTINVSYDLMRRNYRSTKLNCITYSFIQYRI